MAAPQVQIVGSDGTVIGSSGQITNSIGSGFNAVVAVSNASVTGTTAYVSLKVGSGRYFGMTASSLGNGPVSVQDASNGNTIGGMTSVATSNGVPVFVGPNEGVPFFTALVVVGTASSPGVVVHFS